MAIGSGCPGWGLEKWGLDPWSGSDGAGVSIAATSPLCGSTGVNANSPISLKVCTEGCSGLGIDCTRITVNGDLVYDASLGGLPYIHLNEVQVQYLGGPATWQWVAATTNTISVWIKPSSAPTPDGGWIWACMDGGGFGSNDNGIGYTAGHEILAYVGNDPVTWAGQPALHDGNWHHVVITKDAAQNCILYIDGVGYGTSAGGAVFAAPNTTHLCVGNRWNLYPTPQVNPPSCFDGDIDELSNWDIVCTPAQVLEIYNKGRGGGIADLSFFAANNQSWYRFGDTPGDNYLLIQDAGANPLGDLTGFNTIPSSIVRGVTWNTLNNGFVAPCDEACSSVQVGDESGPVVEGLSYVTFSGDAAVGEHLDLPVGQVWSTAAEGTISVWMKVTADPLTTGWIWATSDPSNDSAGLYYRETSDRLEFLLDGVVKIFTTPPLLDGQWHHIVTVGSGLDVTLYMDGVDCGTETWGAGSLIDTTRHTCVGGRWDVAYPVIDLDNWTLFKGFIDEFSSWDKALSGPEVTELYGYGREDISYHSAFLTDNKSYYRMGDSIGDIYPTIMDVGAYPLGDATMVNMTAANLVYVGGLAHLENLCLYFTLCCTPFDCGSDVTVSGIFCDGEGNVLNFGDCVFTVNDCNFIENLELIDSRHIVVRFKNRMLPNPALNPALYLPTSYTVMPVSGGFVDGREVVVDRVLVEKSFLPKLVILELRNPIERGGMYEVVGDSSILDIYKQGLISTGNNKLTGTSGESTLMARRTRVDSALDKLPKMYKQLINNEVEDNQKVISIWQIFAAIGIEDERRGGDY